VHSDSQHCATNVQSSTEQWSSFRNIILDNPSRMHHYKTTDYWLPVSKDSDLVSYIALSSTKRDFTKFTIGIERSIQGKMYTRSINA